jgi:predicted nucleic acid-binding protein
MKVFVDTSALLAVIYEADENHASASAFWVNAVAAGDELYCTNYILVETIALIQSRHGLPEVRQLEQDIVPILNVHWITREDHLAAIENTLGSNRRSVSLVDCSSFQAMQKLRIGTAFTFDKHFRERGFAIVP